MREANGGVHSLVQAEETSGHTEGIHGYNGLVDGPQDQPSERFSSEEAMSRAHQMRADSMAILVGVGTIVRDDPSLTVRGPDISLRESP